MSSDPVILYVEDDPKSGKVMRLALRQMGITTFYLFEDSHDFINRVNALDPQPDVIFLDIHLKPYDGFAMLNMLRELPALQDVPVVALTASVMNEEIQQLRTSGFNGCIGKPINTDSLPDMLQSILSGQEIWRITG